MASKTVKSKRPGTHALRRVVRHYAREACRGLARGPLSDSAVHDARRALKRARTAVRLLRTALGRSTYRRENARLRDAAHALNAARDSRVMVQTLDSLRRAHRQLRTDQTVVRLSRVLRDEELGVQRQLRRRPEALLVPSRRSLDRVVRRAAGWQVGRHGWSVLGPAFRRIYRTGRRALPADRSRPSDATLHEWRKQVKYLRYALQMLAPMRPQALPALARQAEALADRLGAAHDLALLSQRTQRLAAGDGLDVQPLLHAIDREHRRLTHDALSSGERLYRARPRDLERRLGRYWQQWRRDGAR